MLSAVSPFHSDRLSAFNLRVGAVFSCISIVGFQVRQHSNARQSRPQLMLPPTPVSAFVPGCSFSWGRPEASDHSHAAEGLVTVEPMTPDNRYHVGTPARHALVGHTASLGSSFEKQFTKREAKDLLHVINGSSSTIKLPYKGPPRTDNFSPGSHRTSIKLHAYIE